METAEDPQQHTGHDGLPGVSPAVATVNVQDTVKLALQHLANSSNGSSSSSSTSSSTSSTPTTTTTRSSSPLTLAVTSSSSISAVARNQQLVARAARQLHRVSPSWQAAARGIITHLNLGAYHRLACLRTSPPPATDNIAAGAGSAAAGQGAHANLGECSGPLPWSLLSAVPALRSLAIHTSQVPGLLSSPGGTFSSIAARLTGLEVEVEYTDGGEVGQLPGSVLQLPALLSCCTGLRQLRLWGDKKAHLPPGVADIILLLPLRRLDLNKVALALEATTTTLASSSSGGGSNSNSSSGGSGSGGGCSPPPLLGGLQELTVQEGGSWHASVVSPALLPQLRQLTKLSWDLIDRDPAPVELGQLTQLRHLEQKAKYIEQWGMGWTGLSALTHLCLLNYNGGAPEQPALPPGISLPHLLALRIHGCLSYAALPVGLTALTSLEVQISVQGGALQQLQKLTRLRQLRLQVECDADLADGLSTLTALEVLGLEGRSDDHKWHGWPRAQLDALSRLRSLWLHGGDGDGLAATVASASACRQLTQLQLGSAWGRVAYISNADVIRLLQLGGLAQLRDLTIGAQHSSRPECLGAWLGQHSSLTRLQINRESFREYDSSGKLFSEPAAAAAAVLGQLPTTPHTLYLGGSTLSDLPACLSRLTNLRGLDVRFWYYVTQLPAWLSQLQRLEWIRLSRGVRTPQPVLGQLPWLRHVVLWGPALQAVVLAHVPHLCWSPFDQHPLATGLPDDLRDPICDENSSNGVVA